MASFNRPIRFLSTAVLLLGGSAVARAAEPAEGKFYHAYYLEHAGGDMAAAAALYAEVADAAGIDPTVRAHAQARLVACREALASSDFANLMPPNALVYVEIKRPGDKLLKLLAQMGLLAGDGAPVVHEGRRLAISPALIKEIIGIRGAAVALTGFNPMTQMPSGVAVFDPGDLEIIRGLIETGLPVGGKPVEPIGGYPTYSVEDRALITLTSRLVIASTDRARIQDVVTRLKGDKGGSLADSDAFATAVENRDDSLMLFYVNAKPVMPIINAFAAGAGANNPQVRMAQTLLDLNSLQSLVGNLAVTDDGLLLEMALTLDEGHHNLVYNFFRTPPISREALRFIPADAAAFVAGGLNDAESRYQSAPPVDGKGTPIVTALDLGREIFANIIGLAVSVLPPADANESEGWRVPDIVAAIHVHDVAKSEAIWAQALGIATMATGSVSMEGQRDTVQGVEVRSFKFPTFSMHVATVESNLLIGSSRSAIERAIVARGDRNSVVDNEAFAAVARKIGPSTTKAVYVHAGRALAMARKFMPSEAAAQIEPVAKALTDTVVSLTVDHSGQAFRVAAQVTGIPNVGDLVASYLRQQVEWEENQGRLHELTRAGKWSEARTQIDQLLADKSGDTDLLQTRFHILAVGLKDREAAEQCVKDLYKGWQGNANLLNNFAWELLTDQQYEGGYDDVALKFAQRSNELTDFANWAYLDTLALAKFRAGDAEEAVKLQRKAVELAGNRGGDSVKQALARYEEALQKKNGDVAAMANSG